MPLAIRQVGDDQAPRRQKDIRRGLWRPQSVLDYPGVAAARMEAAAGRTVHRTGHVTRQQDASDRRFIQLDLTDSGNNLLNAIFGKSRLWMANKMTALNADELDTLIRAMTILKTTFDSPED